MAEPEGLLIDAAHRATTALARLWRPRDGSGGGAPDHHLEHHRDRLRWLVAAAFGRELPIRVAQPPAPPTALARLFGPRRPVLRVACALPATNGAQLFLPARLTPGHGLDSGRWFRALALRQAACALRLRRAPPPALDGPALDLYRMAEAAAAERDLLAALPGLGADLARLRAAVRPDRPALEALSPRERAVERRYRALLADPAGGCADPLDWAQAVARSLTAAGRYRGLPRDLWWGEVYPVPDPACRTEPAPADGGRPPPAGRMARRPAPRGAEADEDEGPEGPWMIQSDDPLQHVEDGGGAKRPMDRGDDDADGLGDSLSELPHARLVTSPEPARELLLSDDPPDPTARAAGPPSAAGAAFHYPEWDYRRGAYRHPGACVRLRQAADGDPQWAERLLARQRPLLQQVRRRFERLRPRRQVLGRQPDGDEVDVDAYVDAFAAMRAGGTLDQRLYRDVRPARRELAIGLLVDISGSTDAWVGGDRRIVDVEKEALLVLCHALDALGDPYAIQAFSGEGPGAVSVWPIKGFDEPARPAVQERIAALGPERYTRAGAALRHAAAGLAARREPHRLLLLLSDGKPNDLDEYEGRYGVEDMRQAVVEATLQGLHCFCLTVDRHAPAYLPHIFGSGRYAVLSAPAQLPTALVDVVRHLLRR